jgi:putative transposase
MRKSRFSEAQIMGVLRQVEGGIGLAEVCQEHGISSATFYKWRSKYGGMDASMIADIKVMEDENRRLKREKPEELVVPDQPYTVWSMDFMADQPPRPPLPTTCHLKDRPKLRPLQLSANCCWILPRPLTAFHRTKALSARFRSLPPWAPSSTPKPRQRQRRGESAAHSD